ncbi:MAG TPA: hypothetical protein VII50_00455 [Acidothermaceae bacterium]
MSTVAGLKFACGCCSDGCICVTHCTTTPVVLNGSLVRKLVVCRKHATTKSKRGVTIEMHVTRDQRRAINHQVGKRGEATDAEVAAWIKKAAGADLQVLEVEYDNAEEK